MPAPPLYPAHLEREIVLRDGKAVTLRPIRPDDAEREADFVRELSDESRFYRFMAQVRELSPASVTHLTQIDYRDHMALVATVIENGVLRQIGVARYVVEPVPASPVQAEFAVAVADAWQSRGIGAHLLTHLIAAARERGIALLFSAVLAGNLRMLGLMKKMGFTLTQDTADVSLLRAELRLIAVLNSNYK